MKKASTLEIGTVLIEVVIEIYFLQTEPILFFFASHRGNYCVVNLKNIKTLKKTHT